MSIFIKGMDMPPHGESVIVVLRNGYAFEPDRDCGYIDHVAIEIPKHGRLIDADALESVIGKHPLNWEYGQGVEDCWSDLQNAPTVIEAEE